MAVVAPRARLHLWRLSLPTLAVSVISLPAAAILFSTFTPKISAIPRRRLSHPPTCSVALDSSSDDVAPDDAADGVFCSCPALQRLHLTPEQATVIRNRVGGITQRKKQQKCNGDNDGRISADVTVGKTIERNLAYLEQHLGMTVEQLRRLVMGYPLVLIMGLETNLIPTIAFFGDALCDSDGDGKCDAENGNIQCLQQEGTRISTFLCEAPNLLEYNVAKRLKPRLERLRRTISKEGGGSATNADEEMLHAIATLTDSRFEMWLSEKNEKQKNGNEHNTNGTADANINAWNTDLKRQSLPRQPNNPSAYVIVSNLQSGGNIGNIVRSASIFGCEECIVVGQKRYRMTGDHGSRLDLPQRHMWSHADAKDYLDNKGVRVYGIEIMENAAPVMQYDRETGVVQFPFERECEGGWSGAAFLFGNEGRGLSTKQREICDEFLFIPQNRGGSGDGFAGRSSGSASMNVACAAAVVLQAYCMWAGYSEARCVGEKFLAM